MDSPILFEEEKNIVEEYEPTSGNLPLDVGVIPIPPAIITLPKHQQIIDKTPNSGSPHGKPVQPVQPPSEKKTNHTNTSKSKKNSVPTMSASLQINDTIFRQFLTRSQIASVQYDCLPYFNKVYKYIMNELITAWKTYESRGYSKSTLKKALKTELQETLFTQKGKKKLIVPSKQFRQQLLLSFSEQNVRLSHKSLSKSTTIAFQCHFEHTLLHWLKLSKSIISTINRKRLRTKDMEFGLSILYSQCKRNIFQDFTSV